MSVKATKIDVARRRGQDEVVAQGVVQAMRRAGLLGGQNRLTGAEAEGDGAAHGHRRPQPARI